MAALYLISAILRFGTEAWKHKKGLHARNTFPLARSSPDQGDVEGADGPMCNFPALDAAYEQGSIVREIPHFGTMSRDRQHGELGLDFQLCDLGFSKKGVPRPVLQGVNCQIPKGHMFGIMGPSGAGKCMSFFLTWAQKLPVLISASNPPPHSLRDGKTKLWVPHH